MVKMSVFRQCFVQFISMCKKRNTTKPILAASNSCVQTPESNQGNKKNLRVVQTPSPVLHPSDHPKRPIRPMTPWIPPVHSLSRSGLYCTLTPLSHHQGRKLQDERRGETSSPPLQLVQRARKKGRRFFSDSSLTRLFPSSRKFAVSVAKIPPAVSHASYTLTLIPVDREECEEDFELRVSLFTINLRGF
jgi:hypothetical protein